MATVETLEKLERRVTISIPREDVQNEVDKRLKVRARTAKADGFRPGKVPMKMVAAQFGDQIRGDVLHEMISKQFHVVVTQNELQVAGTPEMAPKTDDVEEGVFAFNLTFEVYPDITIGDLTSLEVEKTISPVLDADVDRTIDVLRKGQAQYSAKEEGAAANDDRATIDFVGMLDGVAFEGGKADNFAFVLGEGKMLPEFEEAIIGLNVGEEKTFPLTFPENYQGKDVAGKTAEFTVTLKSLEAAKLPDLDDAFAAAVGVEDGGVDKLRADVRENLETEGGTRLQALNKTKVMDALLTVCEFDVPSALISQESDRLSESMKQNMAQRGMDAASMPDLPREIFAPQAERRVRLGLILGDMVEEQQLIATDEQVKTEIEKIAKTYQQPQMVIDYYYGDNERLNEVKNVVMEENVVSYIMSQAKVTEVEMSFEDLMAQQQQQG